VPFSSDLRKSAEAFSRAFLEKNPGSQLAIWEFGGADIPVVPFTNDITKLADGSKKLFPKGTISQAQADAIAAGAATARGQNIVGSNLLEAIVGVSKELAKRQETRRVIVSMNADVSVESNGIQGPKVQEEVVKANAQWFGISLQAQVANGPLRDNVMNELIPYSGGTRHTIVSIQALEAELVNVADIIANQYAVTYKRVSGEPKRVAVGMRGGPPDIKVAAARFAQK
jgi:nicotinamide mononucleotide (NMN) deamidase PncC